MRRPTLLSTLRRLWPDFRWTNTQAGLEKGCVGEASPYTLVVEWRGGNTTIAVTRHYGEGSQVSVVGAAVGTTAEGVRRAYAEARLAWISLQRMPDDPRPTTLEEILADQDYMSGLLRGLKPEDDDEDGEE